MFTLYLSIHLSRCLNINITHYNHGPGDVMIGAVMQNYLEETVKKLRGEKTKLTSYIKHVPIRS